jgi:hypothetical protein
VEGNQLGGDHCGDARDEVRVFLTRRDVEATNNESERALPPLGDILQSARSTPTSAGRHRPPRCIDSHREAPEARPAEIERKKKNNVGTQ